MKTRSLIALSIQLSQLLTFFVFIADQSVLGELLQYSVAQARFNAGNGCYKAGRNDLMVLHAHFNLR